MSGADQIMPWVSDPTNLTFVLAALIGAAFLLLALRPRRQFAEGTVVAGGVDESITEPPPPPPPPPTAFEFLTAHGVEKWNAARLEGKYVNADFSDVGEAFQAKAEGSKIWGVPVEFHNSKPRLMLRGIDLAGANLAGCDLHYADLRNADLTEASLVKARLDNALMPNVRLNDADLRGAKLDNAILSNANMQGANLEDASVDGATFSWADMRGAKGNRKQLERVADLVGARLANASFDGAKARFQIAGRNLLSKRPIVWR
ncbi:MAG: hypothetical protein GC190_15640 [Alphaproteobacteria bacterium]|nr:hypothetical protein [Alphaproteobacteria bacterium]